MILDTCAPLWPAGGDKKPGRSALDQINASAIRVRHLNFYAIPRTDPRPPRWSSFFGFARRVRRTRSKRLARSCTNFKLSSP